MLKAESGEVVGGWPVNIARQLNTAPIITRLYPLDLTLIVSIMKQVLPRVLWEEYTTLAQLHNKVPISYNGMPQIHPQKLSLPLRRSPPSNTPIP